MAGMSGFILTGSALRPGHIVGTDGMVEISGNLMTMGSLIHGVQISVQLWTKFWLAEL